MSESWLKSYVAFDLETTGLSPVNDAIIEIGALKVKDGRIVQRFSQFINPQREISAQVTGITGITNEMVANAPTFEKVLPGFLDFCGDEVLLGHNIMFDYRFTNYWAARCGLAFEKQGIDTLKLARIIHKDLKSKSLEAMCAHYHIVNEDAHRAYYDALTTAKLYQTMAHYHYKGNETLFLPTSLAYKEKKEQKMTNKQKGYLIDFCKYHRIEFKDAWSELTRSQASRTIDQLIAKHGRMFR